jgi:hypothetical protein
MTLEKHIVPWCICILFLPFQNALINGLRFNDNAKRVQCTVENAIGAGSGVLELDVPCEWTKMAT